MNSMFYSMEQLYRQKEEFEEFLKKKNIKSIKQYISDYEYFTKNYVLDKVVINDIESFFSKCLIEEFLYSRRSNTASAMLRNLIEFMYSNYNFNADNYLKYNNRVKKGSRKKDKQEISFLTQEDIKFIMSDEVKFKFEKDRDKELMIVSPIVWGLSYYCCFEQNHITKLTIDDLKLEINQIRNIRSDESYLAKRWIEINNEFKHKLKSYIEYRKTLDIRTNKLILYSNSEAANKELNKMYDVLDRVDNSKFLSTTVDSQKIVRSRVMHMLLLSNGEDMSDLLHLFGLEKKTQFESAVSEYLVLKNSF